MGEERNRAGGGWLAPVGSPNRPVFLPGGTEESPAGAAVLELNSFAAADDGKPWSDVVALQADARQGRIQL